MHGHVQKRREMTDVCTLHVPSSVPLTLLFLIVQQCVGGWQEITGVKACNKTGVFVVIYGADAQMLVIFLFWGRFCASFRELATPFWVLCVLWYLGCIFMISPWFTQQSPHAASLLLIFFSQCYFNTGQSLQKASTPLASRFWKT